MNENILYIIGAIILLEAIQLGVRHLYKKVEREDIVLKVDFEIFKESCEKKKFECAACFLLIKNRQQELREDLPKNYVQKNDFILVIGEVKGWLASIDAKVDRLIERGLSKEV